MIQDDTRLRTGPRLAGRKAHLGRIEYTREGQMANFRKRVHTQAMPVSDFTVSGKNVSQTELLAVVVPVDSRMVCFRVVPGLKCSI
jgi:hypothetical protein